MTRPIRSILLLQGGALGDTVLQMRLAQIFRHALSEAAVTWLGRDGWLPIARRCTCIDRLVGMDALRSHRLFEQSERTDADLAEWLRDFDLIVNGLAPADSPAALRLRQFARVAGITYDTRPREGSRQHIITQWLEQLIPQLAGIALDLAKSVRCAAGPSLEAAETLLEPAPEDLREAAALLKAAGLDGHASGCFVLVHPGSGGRDKCWPMERYVRLMEILANRGRNPVMIVGAAEMERLGAEVDAVGRRHPLVIDPALSALIGLASTAGVYVGNDSGPTHLAAALGRPTVALFGPTEPAVWRPIGPKVSVFRSRNHEAGWADVAAESVAAAVT